MKIKLSMLPLLLASSPLHASDWFASWGAPPAPPQPPIVGLAPRLIAPTFDNQTIVQSVRLSIGGKRLRVRLSNEYGTSPLDIGAVSVVVLDEHGAPVRGSERMILSAGHGDFIIPPRAPLLSDAVDLSVGKLAKIRISLFVRGKAPECSCHEGGGETVQVSPAGDFTRTAFAPLPLPNGSFHAFLSGVDVETDKATHVVVTLGDSITDGFRSTNDSDARYPDRLAERLAHSGGAPVGVVNAGINGNRLLSEPKFVARGVNALARFDRDVLSVTGVTHMIVLEGINDLGNGGDTPPSADALIGAYRQLIERAHARHVLVIGATILPYEGAPYFKPQGEKVRVQVNSWIREGHAFDGVADLDRALRDPGNVKRLRGEYQSGDWLHPNDAGYKAMADAIDLTLLR